MSDMLRLSHRMIRVAVGLLVLVLLYAGGHELLALTHGGSQVNEATYLGTLIAVTGAVFSLGKVALGRTPTAQVQDRLHDLLVASVSKRIEDLKLGTQDINLSFDDRQSGRQRSMEDLLGHVATQRSFQVAIVGERGSGKSYTALRMAQRLLGEDRTLSVVIPMSRWSEPTDITTCIARYLVEEFAVSEARARTLVERGTVVPIFDGLDELTSVELHKEFLEDFLRLIRSWRVAGGRGRFVVTAIQEAWDSADRETRRAAHLHSFRTQAVTASAAEDFLADELEIPLPRARDIVRVFEREGLGPCVTQASKLAILARIADALPRPIEPENLVANIRGEGLYPTLLRTLVRKDNRSMATLWRALAIAELIRMARYLRDNRDEDREVADEALEQRDVVLHRLWPFGGQRAPRYVDVGIAFTMSLPGLAWTAYYLNAFDYAGNLAFLVFATIWLSMLVRTGKKAWVRPASPDLSRLKDPRFLLPQTAAALALAGLSSFFAPVWLAFAVFAVTWLAIGLTVGFGQTLATDSQLRIIGPEGVLRRERQVSRHATLVTFPLVAVAFGFTFHPIRGVVLAAIYSWLVAETVACALWRRYLALCLTRVHRLITPVQTTRLGYRLGLLRATGLSYQFREEDLATFMTDLPASPAKILRLTRT